MLSSQYMQLTYTPDEPQLLLREKPEDPQIEPHAEIKMVQVWYLSPLYLLCLQYLGDMLAFDRTSEIIAHAKVL